PNRAANQPRTMTSLRYLLLLALATACTGDGLARSSRVPVPMVPVDSTVLQETDSTFLASPGYFTIDSLGGLYISDPVNGRILHFSRSGDYLGRIGERGSGPGGLSAPLAT